MLRAQGVSRGDRVAIFLPQAPEVAAAHMAIYKLGAIALPVAILFGPDALSYRLQNSGAKALLTNSQGLAKLSEVRDQVSELACVLSIDGAADGAHDFKSLLARASSDFTPVDTAADDPAMMIYTSGTTGQPKGALHGHRVLLGHMPGAELPHYPFPQQGDELLTAPTLATQPVGCSMYCCRSLEPRRSRWWRASSTSSIRTRLSRLCNRRKSATPSSRRPRCA